MKTQNTKPEILFKYKKLNSGCVTAAGMLATFMLNGRNIY